MENNEEQSGGEALMYSDSYLLPKIQQLHSGTISSDELRRTLLTLAEEFIKGATGTIEQHSKDALLEGGNKGTHTLQNLGYKKMSGYENINVPEIIGKLSSQMISEILNGNDTHNITLKFLSYLSNFLWRDKLAFILAAFVITFGEFWLLVRIYADNVVNESMTSTNKEAYKNLIEANNEFIIMLVNSLRCFFDLVLVDMDRVPIYVYWIVRCAIVAAIQIIGLSNMGVDRYLVGIQTRREVEKLKSLNQELMHTLSKTKERNSALATINTKISNQADAAGFMRIIIKDKAMLPLYHGATKRRDHLDVLRGKRVLLLISGIDIASEDITSLKHVTINTKTDEIVWIPLINHSIAELDPIKTQLQTLQNSMPWYSVHQPSMVTQDTIDLFKTESDFRGRPFLLVVSPSGRVLRTDTIHIVRIWQNLSVDYLTYDHMEQQMWKKETWNLKLLINDIIIDPILQKWIRDERYIILYGGNDVDWIRRFIKQVHSIASDLQARIEMVYVGNGHSKDRGRRVQNVILIEQLSHCLPESSITYFWTRFDSMLESKKEFIDLSVPKDNLLQEMLRFHNHEEWVLLAQGSTILVNGAGQIALSALEDIKKWRTKLLQS